jgi:hypothetical protein
MTFSHNSSSNLPRKLSAHKKPDRSLDLYTVFDIQKEANGHYQACIVLLPPAGVRVKIGLFVLEVVTVEVVGVMPVVNEHGQLRLFAYVNTRPELV